MNEDPKPGDVVMMKSGGPLMTVVGTEKNDKTMLACAWFEPDHTVRRRRSITRTRSRSSTPERWTGPFTYEEVSLPGCALRVVQHHELSERIEGRPKEPRAIRSGT